MDSVRGRWNLPGAFIGNQVELETAALLYTYKASNNRLKHLSTKRAGMACLYELSPGVLWWHCPARRLI